MNIKKRVLIISCSHWSFSNKLRKKMKEEELLDHNYVVEELLYLGNEKYNNVNQNEELLNNKYELIIIQWNTELEQNSERSRLLLKIENMFKKTLENGGTIVHLFELTEKGIDKEINVILKETSPAQYIINSKTNKSCVPFLKEGYNFEVFSDSFVNTAFLVDSLNNKGIIKSYSTLKVVDEHVKVHITSGKYPILLTKQIEKGCSISLAFSFCGSWNAKQTGLDEFLKLLISEIIVDTILSNDEPIEIIENEQIIKNRVGYEGELEEEDLLSNVENYLEALQFEEGNGIEGTKKTYVVNKYERDPENRNKAIEIHGLNCIACGINFQDVYGEHGKGFIEVHHIIPLSSLEEAMEINPATDLVPLCANCHRMVHRRKDNVLSVDELKELILEQREKSENIL